MNEQPDKKLICPECSGVCKEVYAEANYGRVLLLDQCNDCGGIWFDNWELYYLKDAEAKRLDTVNLNSLLAKSLVQKGTGLCPRRCGIPLESFQDPNLPVDSRINRCKRCNGLWLNRGELVKYEENKNRLRSRFEKTEPSTKGAISALAVNSQQAKWETIGHMRATLRTRPEQDINVLESGDTNWDRAEITNDALFLILQILFKVIFKI